jgi:hypothetical protein
VIPGQAFAVAELSLAAVTVLAAISITSEEECIGDLSAEPAGHMDEFDEANDGRFGQGQSFASDHVTGVRFDDLGFPFDDQAKGSPERDHCEWLERGVQRQTPHSAVS